MTRQYQMSGRQAAMQHTRERILDAAQELFTPAWFDEVTMADIARAAGVSQQTVVNHFGSKSELFLVGLHERYVPGVEALRASATPGDVDSIVDVLLRDYEVSGDGTIRNLALAGRMAELAPVIEGGRQFHAAWVARVCGPLLEPLDDAARAERLRLLGVALDVRAWHQLRREHGLDVEQTRSHLATLVRALLVA